MSIVKNIQEIRQRIEAAAVASGRSADEITLVGAAKMNPAEAVQEAIHAGIDAIGENRVQELMEKQEQNAYVGAPLHLIGHLQKNKVKYVVGVVDLIESVDSEALLQAIAARAEKLGIVQDVLLEINIAGEASKSGMAPAELPVVLQAAAAYPSIRIRGLMAIPPISHEIGGNRVYFAKMCQLFVDIKAKKYDNVTMDFLSMGMSGDFEDAILEGANMVRIGSAIFGARTYPVKP